MLTPLLTPPRLRWLPAAPPLRCLPTQVAGTSPSPNAPDELRLEMVVPAAIAPGVLRPVINDVPKNMNRGG